ncbi:DUF3105 domain-containing protein [Herbiconiux sp.]|uniref:DUF3105 domain-containing protein n=1 Tax=Herbiconiux sp. TaxID=1871186 RepID=UPI0025B84C1F|nr:DUF3105 domain-containing protein [Herbiconiux sp.]
MSTVPSRSDSSSSLLPKAKEQAKKLTVKQERDARRAEKVAAMVAEQKRQQRNRRFAWIGGSVAGVAVVALVIGFVVTSAEPKVDPASIAIGELQTYPDLTSNHVSTKVDYAQTPPAGGDHAAVWLNCGVYSEAVPNENAVHALEHGAVWVTYDPTVVDEAGVETLRSELPDTYVVLSPFPGLSAPVVASAWGNQVYLDGVDDERLSDFVTKFWRSNDAPEPGAACTGGLDAPGKVA